MMLKRIMFTLMMLPFLFQANAQFKGALDKAKNKVEQTLSGGGALSQEEIGNGLKEALDAGVGEAVDFLSAEDGYYKTAYKILLPEEAQKVTAKLRAVPGWSNVEQTLEEKMNRAAEIAVQKAKPIFVSAIKQMTFKDAMNILMGEKNAATAYLHKTTYQSLFNEFMPVIQSALDELLRGRTSFVIAHRLSTIRNADQVLVLNQGQIIERGTHAELLARHGFYYDLYMSQFRYQEELASANGSARSASAIME